MSGVEGERCYQCGRAVQLDDASCPACGAVQKTVCEECYTTVSVYDEACVNCGAELLTKRYSPSKAPWVILVAVIVFAALGYGLFRAVRPRPFGERREALGQAREDFNAGRYEAARRGLEPLARTKPAKLDVHYLLGRTLFELGELDAAAAELEIAHEMAPNRPAVALDLAVVRYEGGRHRAAFPPAVRAILDEKCAARANLVIGKALSWRGGRDASEALHHLLEAIREGEDDLETCLLIAAYDRMLARNLPLRMSADPGIRRALDILERHPDQGELTEVEAVVAKRLESPGPAREKPGPLTSTVHGRLLEVKLALDHRKYTRAIALLGEVAAVAPDDPEPFLLLADGHGARGEWDLVALDLTSAIHIAGPDAELLTRRADAHLRDGLPDRALLDAWRAREIDAEAIGPTLVTARIRLTSGHPEEAIEALRGQATDPRALLLVARAHAVAGRKDEARKAYASVVANASEEEHRLDAVAALADLETSERAWARYLDSHPESVAGWVAWARRRLETLGPSAAEMPARKALEVDPESTEARWLLLEAGFADPESRDPMETRRLLAEITEREPNSALDSYLRGREALEGSVPVTAESHLLAAEEMSPLDGRVARWLGIARLRAGKAGPARRSYLRAVHLDPQDLEARLLLVSMGGVAAGASGSPKSVAAAREACRDLIRDLTDPARESVDVEGKLVPAWLLLGNLCDALEDREGRLAACEAHLARRPEDPAAILREAAARRGATPLDESVLREAVRQDPDDPDAADTLVGHLLAKGRNEDARAFVADWSEGTSRHGDAACLLGRVLLAEGKPPAQAVAAFEAALAREPITPSHRAEAWEGLLRLHAASPNWAEVASRTPEFTEWAREAVRLSGWRRIAAPLAAAHQRVGLAHEFEGRPELADHHYWRSIVVRPDFLPALSGLESVLRSRLAGGDSEETAGVLAAVLLRTALVLTERGERERAREHLEQAVRLFPRVVGLPGYRRARESSSAAGTDTDRK